MDALESLKLDRTKSGIGELYGKNSNRGRQINTRYCYKRNADLIMITFMSLPKVKCGFNAFSTHT